MGWVAGGRGARGAGRSECTGFAARARRRRPRARCPGRRGRRRRSPPPPPPPPSPQAPALFRPVPPAACLVPIRFPPPLLLTAQDLSPRKLRSRPRHTCLPLHIPPRVDPRHPLRPRTGALQCPSVPAAAASRRPSRAQCLRARDVE